MKQKWLLILISLLIIFSSAEAKLFKGKKVEEEATPSLPPLVGPKKMVAVHNFENKVENPDSYWWHNPKLGTGMSDMLVTALMDTDYFIVLEREALQDGILAEQDLAASGRTTAQGHAKTGKILQAQSLIQGAVTIFDENTKGKEGKTGFSYGNVSIGLGGGGGEAVVGVDIRIYDTATGQILAAETCKGIAKSKGRGISVGLTGTHNGKGGAIALGGSDFEKTPLGDATRDAIQSCVNFIVTQMNKVPWAGKVMKVAPDGKVYINCGSRNNIKTGDEFSVYAVGETFIDPDTGEDLGSEESFLGKIRVIDLKEKFSIASIVEGAADKENIIRWSQK